MLLLEIRPRFTPIASDGDYFHKEQVALWGQEAGREPPHDPRIDYYRFGDCTISRSARLFQFLIPMIPRSYLGDGVESHLKRMKQGITPTAVALSHLDVKGPADWDGNTDVTEHY